MNDWNRPMNAGPGGMTVDQAGVKAFMLGVYNKLAIGIALSGLLAFIAGTVPPIRDVLFGTPLSMVVAFLPAGLLLFSAFFMRNPSPASSAFVYWAVVVTIGLSMGVYFAMAGLGVNGMSNAVIAKAFFVTAATFGGLSLFGYTTKRDLGPIGTFAFMGIWAMFVIAVLAFVLPMIFPSIPGIQFGSGLDLMISGGFALFSAALIAWQTQALKEGYYQNAHDGRTLAVLTNMGALNFFVSFINLLQFFLRLMADD